MIALGSNLLVYSHRRDSPWYARARRVVSELAASGAPWAIPWHCLHEFYAVATNPKAYKPSSTIKEAADQIDAWLESPSLSLLAEDLETWPILRDLVGTAQIVGGAMHDARIAAVCLRHGVTELWTADRDFTRFPALRVRNPLIDIHPTRAGEQPATYQLASRKRRPARPKLQRR